MFKIVFASNNKGKWIELADDFKKVNIDLILSEKKLILEEDDLTLVSNSYSKAKSAAQQTGLFSIGDDSGIFIEELDYFPGVFSRRWFGNESDDLERNKKIIEIMKEIENKNAFLISRFVLVDPSGKKLFSTSVKNKFSIADEVKGCYGFGYDPILIPSEEMVYSAAIREEISIKRAKEIINKRLTIGELTQEEKNSINNRGRIAKEIDKFLKENTNGTLVRSPNGI